MKRLLGNAIANIEFGLGHFQLSALMPVDCRPLAVLMYHGLETEPERLAADPLNIHPDTCLAEIKFFLRQGYHPISPEGIAQLTKGDQWFPKARGFLLVTFDDGFACIREPLMKWLQDQLTFPVLIAVCPAAVESECVLWFEEVSARLAASSGCLRVALGNQERVFFKYQTRDLLRFMCEQSPAALNDLRTQIREQTTSITTAELMRCPQVHKLMSWSDLKALRDTRQTRFAAHSMRHQRATSFTPEEFNDDAAQCKRMLESELGVSCEDFVYPFGSENDYSDTTEAILERNGFRRTYTSRSKLNWQIEIRRLDRLRGDGLSRSSLRYYRHLWRQWHAAPKLEDAEPQ
jgi:hypothetical protein